MSLAVKKRILSCLTSAWILSISTTAQAQLGISVASGIGANDITPYRAALLIDFDPWVVTIKKWLIIPIWETSVAYWDAEPSPQPGSNDSLTVVTTGPMFRLQRHVSYSYWTSYYFELGIAAAWLSKDEIAGRKLSMHFQFEDKFGVGFRFGREGQYDLSFRAVHYSNGSCKRPNHGVNMGMLNLSYWF